jgi:REP element-mobilizing transposase RayT
MSTKYKIRNQEALHFISFATVEWIDVFTRPIYKEVIVESLKYCQQSKGLILYAWCLMTNHVHLIISTNGKNKQEDILRDFKKFTAKKCLELIESNDSESRKNWMLWIFKSAGKKNSNNIKYQFWRQDNHPIELDSNKLMDQKLEYIHNNPVEEGIVDVPEEYLYSSARNYAGRPGLIQVELIG